MATQVEKALFIEEIAPYAQKAYKELGKVKPSVCIGMACVESAYGTSKIMRKNNAFLGHKVGSGRTAKKYWGGKFFVSKTKEEYTVGTHKIITDAFRGYDSMQQCVLNYYELLNTSLYSRVKADADYKTQMKQIKTCGYMTSSTEVNTVLKIIQDFNLTKYDFNSGTVEKSYQEIAQEVIDGKWGNGADRKARLKAAGYNPALVQQIVNKMLKK